MAICIRDWGFELQDIEMPVSPITGSSPELITEIPHL
jgi:hypothetical protein